MNRITRYVSSNILIFYQCAQVTYYEYEFLCETEVSVCEGFNQV